MVMMGAHHSISGAAAWIAITSTAPYTLGVHPLPAASVALGALVTAGAALLPDADHHNGTIAHSAGPLTQGLAGAEHLSGGHRHGLHSLLAVAGFTVTTVLAARWSATVPVLGQIPAGSALIFLALVAFATKALHLSRGGSSSCGPRRCSSYSPCSGSRPRRWRGCPRPCSSVSSCTCSATC